MESKAQVADSSLENSGQSSILAVVDPVTTRIIGLFKGLSEMYAAWREKDFLARQIGIILEAVREELEDEPTLFANPSGRLMILNFSLLLEWTVTGDYSKLPEELLPIACKIEGRPVPQTQGTPLFEIEA
jgi:hypothetical protein